MSSVLAPPREQTTETDTSPNAVETMLDVVRRNGVLTSIDFTSFEGRTMVDSTGEVKVLVNNVEADKDVADELMTRNSWKLAPREWRLESGRIRNRAKRAVLRYGAIFRRGVYLVPLKKYDEIYQELDQIRIEYDQFADQKVATWPAECDKLKAKIVEKYGERTWQSVESKLPRVDKIRSRFSMTIGAWPIGGSTGGPEIAKLIDDLSEAVDDLSIAPELPSVLNGKIGAVLRLTGALRAAASGLPQHFSAEKLAEYTALIRNSTEQMLRESLTRAFDEPRQELYESIDNLLRIINESSSVRQPSVDAVKRAWDRLKGFSWLAPDDLAQRMEELDRRVNNTSAEDIRDGTRAARETLDAIKGFRDLLADSSSDMRFFGG